MTSDAKLELKAGLFGTVRDDSYLFDESSGDSLQLLWVAAETCAV
jgi:hypothetical protein